VATLGLIGESGSEQQEGADGIVATPLNFKEEYTINTLRSILDIMGLKEQDIQEIITLATSKADEMALKQDIISARQKEVLQSIGNNTKTLLGVQERMQHIVSVQAVTRGWLVRNRLRDLRGEERKRQMAYNRTFSMILDREKRYLTGLKMLVDRFLTPIRARMVSGKEVLRLEEVSFIFCNVEVLLEEHKSNARRLESLLDLWPFVKGVGKVFLEMSSGLKGYGIYVGNYKNAQDTILRLKNEKGKFATFLTEVSSRCI
jgi:hypothetical protein